MESSLITSGFVLVTGFSDVTFGELADIFPTAHLMTVSVVLLANGSIIGIFSQQFWDAIFARIVQGAGADADSFLGKYGDDNEVLSARKKRNDY